MIVLLAAAAVCTGCVGSALESNREEPEVFRLTTPETPDAGAALPEVLAVGRPRAPVSLDTERIAVAGPDTRFDYYSGIRWAEPAPLMIQHLLVEALAADGRFATVVAVPSRVPSKYQLEIELRRFEAETDGHGPPVVKVEMQVMLLDGRGGTLVASFPATASVVAEGDRRAAVLSAFNAATRQAIGSIVGDAQRGRVSAATSSSPLLGAASRCRRSARVSRGPVTTIEERCRVRWCPAHVSERTVPAAVARNRAESSPRVVRDVYLRLFRRGFGPRDTRSKRRLRDAGHRRIASRRVDVVVSQPRSRPPSPQLDVAGTLSEGRLDDSAIPTTVRCARQDVRGTLGLFTVR
jgi:cholesterol transport system auxiliary component